MGDVQLVGDQAGALATQAAPRHTVLFTLELTCAIAQREAVHSIDLPGKQAILRFAENQFAVEQHFTQDDIGLVGIQASANVGEQSILFFYVFNLELPAIMASVQAVFTGGGEEEGNHTRIDSNDGSQSKFAFCIADPALTKCKRHSCSALIFNCRQ